MSRALGLQLCVHPLKSPDISKASQCSEFISLEVKTCYHQAKPVNYLPISNNFADYLHDADTSNCGKMSERKNSNNDQYS